MNYNNQKSYGLYALVFIVSSLMRFDLNVLARVPLGELIAFGVMPMLFFMGNLGPARMRILHVLLPLGLWSLGIFVSDLINGIYYLDSLKAFAKPVWVLLWALFFSAVILKDWRALVFWPIGNFFASLQNYFFPRMWTEEDILRGGYDAVAFGLNPIFASLFLVLSLLLFNKSKVLSALMLLVGAFVGISIGAPRSSIAVQLATAALLLGISFLGNQQSDWLKEKNINFKTILLSIVTVLVGGFILFEIYKYAAGEFWLGEAAYEKYIAQSATVFGNSIIGLFLSGRTDVFGAILGIIDRPFVGYGSWTGVSLYMYQYDAIRYVGTDAALIQGYHDTGAIRGVGHSILFQAWLENGILAAVSLLWISVIMIKQTVKAVLIQTVLTPWIIMFGVGFAWSFLFSPFGVGSRVVMGLLLAFFLCDFSSIVRGKRRFSVNKLGDSGQGEYAVPTRA